jgi:hypothetical protein
MEDPAALPPPSAPPALLPPAPPANTPYANPVRIKYIESLLSNAVSKLLLILPYEWQSADDLMKQEETRRATSETIQHFLPYVFFLDFSQKNSNLALYMDLAVTLVKKMLHVGVNSLQTITPFIAGLIPLPEAGTVGALVGWLFSLYLLAFAAGIGVVSNDFGYTAESLAGMIPVVGSSAMRMVHSADETATRYMNKFYRMTGTTESPTSQPLTLSQAWTGTKDGLWTAAAEEEETAPEPAEDEDEEITRGTVQEFVKPAEVPAEVQKFIDE